jgi:hypothetical protein
VRGEQTPALGPIVAGPRPDQRRRGGRKGARRSARRRRDEDAERGEEGALVGCARPGLRPLGQAEKDATSALERARRGLGEGAVGERPLAPLFRPSMDPLDARRVFCRRHGFEARERPEHPLDPREVAFTREHLGALEQRPRRRPRRPPARPALVEPGVVRSELFDEANELGVCLKLSPAGTSRPGPQSLSNGLAKPSHPGRRGDVARRRHGQQQPPSPARPAERAGLGLGFGDRREPLGGALAATPAEMNQRRVDRAFAVGGDAEQLVRLLGSRLERAQGRLEREGRAIVREAVDVKLEQHDERPPTLGRRARAQGGLERRPRALEVVLGEQPRRPGQRPLCLGRRLPPPPRRPRRLDRPAAELPFDPGPRAPRQRVEHRVGRARLEPRHRQAHHARHVVVGPHPHLVRIRLDQPALQARLLFVTRPLFTGRKPAPRGVHPPDAFDQLAQPGALPRRRPLRHARSVTPRGVYCN